MSRPLVRLHLVALCALVAGIASATPYYNTGAFVRKPAGTADNPGTSCLDIHNRSPGLGSTTYFVKPPGSASTLQVYCDMSLAGGGWMLVSNRRGGANNVETCGSTLAQFFTSGCGSPTSVGYSNSYAMSATDRALFPRTEYLLIQYDAGGVPDSDDAYRMTTTTDLFPNTTAVQQLPLTQACSLDGSVCDTTNVFWKYIGDFWFHNASCFAGSSGSTQYRGNYGLCTNGAADQGNSGVDLASGTFGNRNEYNETKLWGWSSGGSSAYQERIFVR